MSDVFEERGKKINDQLVRLNKSLTLAFSIQTLS
eukprot:CAMPEP_0170554206 /NCGR_PEP_ID=MMETSP0211-20121228/12083_1 /TAXON_ID=311385 /ORGANISM="Pseudokeronopsis sp., Strain OXSARD2" /LENGTH=33 /DNA_ID= /DNA_START= /DNA_END= /DNA_ORIENTATION=